MLPKSFRVMNTKDLVPRHPVLCGHHGVGTRYFIDKEGGGTPTESIGCCNIVLGALTSVSHHMPDAYLQSFIIAVEWFNAEYPPLPTTQHRFFTAIHHLEHPEYSY